MGGHLSHLKPEASHYVLNCSCGPIRGNIYKHGVRTVEGYLGIPYAKPPIGNLKFKKPVAFERWDTVRDCTIFGPVCPQTNILNSNSGIPMAEDNCLTLNVFRPTWESPEYSLKGRPVMVFIHGGGYEMGSSRDFCDYSLTGTLTLKDVIVVTINYRLNIFGFLTTGDEVCRGNFGLWDQTLALKWIQEHIQSFGGDANNVTVFGQSAGGASVDLLSLSPHSRDLFHKMIAMSGASASEFAMRTADSQSKIFREYARKHGYKGSDNSEELLSWYKSTPLHVLIDFLNFPKSVSGFLSFTPNLDGDFFPKPLEQLRKEAPRKPIMTGVCEYEGLMLALLGVNPESAGDDVFRSRLRKSYGADIFDRAEEVQKEILDFYMKDVDMTNEANVKKQLVIAVGDLLFNHGAYVTARECAKFGNPVYFYTFAYANLKNFGALEAIIPFKAPTHCSDLRYVLGEGYYSKFEPDDDDMKMLEIMTSYYTNFAKYGNPNNNGTNDWKTYDLKRPFTCFRITLPKSYMSDDFADGRLAFLDEVHKRNIQFNKLRYGKL
ncbi:unnamed protein product [Caenorhabditis bovis]|uniref:Carboxylic ester hydrolase n=1 Tax=Caenorhabditis bovis TaxID=2654633 RepID=A0A8S1EAL7_9PELO|nr:unnamed protein product [Caenorhabditis bovis]